MTVLFAEGFTGIARGNRNFLEGATSDMGKLGWYQQGRANGTGALANDGNLQSRIIADPIFADRNVYQMAKTAASTANFFTQIRKSIDTRGYSKFVLGTVVQYDTAGNDANGIYVCISGSALWTSSTANYPLTEIIANLQINNNGTNGTAYEYLSTSPQTAVSAALVKGKPIHIELFVEQDVRRLRLYLNGVLTLDTALQASFNFAKIDGGISLVLLTTGATTTQPMYLSWSNLYFLGCDAIHTGILGPATRVLEMVPPSDVIAQFERPNGYASNAAVLAQNFDATAPVFLTSGEVGKYDLYAMPSAVRANAAQIFGAGLRINALSMAEGSHALKPVVSSGGAVAETGTEIPLTLGVITPSFADMSVNPATGAVWTPTETQTYSFGMKLIR